MPPKKKARVSQVTSPEPEPPQKTPTPPAESPSKTDSQMLSDPWTDEEEIGLFKGLMRFKPTGIHKHFRLLALHAWLLEHSYIHPGNLHTKPEGIWAKLNTLYDLAALDAREDARQLSPLRTTIEQQEEEQRESEDEAADVYSVSGNKIESEEFDLVGCADGAGFEHMMWKARFPQRKMKGEVGEESDAELPELNMAAEPPVRFVPSFSLEPSEAATPSSRATKGKAVGAKKSGKAAPARRRSSRKTESVADKESEEEKVEEADEGDEDEERTGDEGESQASTPGPRRGRSGKGAKGKTATKPKARARTRVK